MYTMGGFNACEEGLPKLRKKVAEKKMKKKMADADVCTAGLLQEYDDEEEMQAIVNFGRRKRAASSSDIPATVFKAKKGKSGKGLTDSLQLGNVERQTSVDDACEEEARARVMQDIALFFYTNGIDLNVVRSESFKLMVEAVGSYGPNLKVPSYRELRDPLFQKELKETKEMLKGHMEEWSKFGCSIMVDAWTDKKNRSLINLMVNCSFGTVFVKSVDASAYMKTGDKLFLLLDTFVEEIGEKNVVQVITDNNSKYELAGKLLQVKRTNLYWTPCAPRCVDLMLEDIGRIPRVKRTIQRGISLVGFIYSYSSSLNMVRKFTNKMELVRYGVTRFATTFLTLQRLYKQKDNLKKMFNSDEWLSSNRSKDAKGKGATNIVLMARFWKDVVYSLKAMGPLAHVLRVVCNEKNPAMGYIYQVMDRAKEAIQKSFHGNEVEYKDIFAIIDKRWECHRFNPLHAAGYFLNPKFFYGKSQIKNDPEVMMGLYKCMERLIPTDEGVDKVTSELALYMRAEGIFSCKLAIRHRVTLNPDEWWRRYGLSAPNLQAFAIKVLSLTCHAYGRERSWNTFENIYFKKRSKLEQQKLEDLVFIKYNQDLKESFDKCHVTDPILLNDIDYCNEWLVGEMSEDGETYKEEEGTHDEESEEEEEEEDEEIYKYINDENYNDEESSEDLGDNEFH